MWQYLRPKAAQVLLFDLICAHAVHFVKIAVTDYSARQAAGGAGY